MADLSDMDLMGRYAERNSEAAFAELIQRHVNLVYSVALRSVGNVHDAQDVTQAVFIILAQKIPDLRDRATLTGWLYETTRFTVRQFLRTRARLQAREQEAYMRSILDNSESTAAWRQLEPLLEEAMSRLNEKERTVVALRYFENKSGAETAGLLGIQEWAARKRSDRAIEKLRKFFSRRGIVLTAAVLTGAMSSHSVQAAPTALPATIASGIFAKGAAASGSTLILSRGALKLMAWARAKMAIATGAAVLLVAGMVAVSLSQARPGRELSPREIIDRMKDSYASLSSYRDEGTVVWSTDGTNGGTSTFSIALARLNLYRMEEMNFGNHQWKRVFWSAAGGDFMSLAIPWTRMKDPDKHAALGASSGGTILCLFFETHGVEEFDRLMHPRERKKDENAGGVDCYVLAGGGEGRTWVLWIGKEDFLIRQLENDTTAAAAKRLHETMAKQLTNFHGKFKTDFLATRMIETHLNIAVNEPFKAADFDYEASPGRNECINNLRWIEEAKQQWAVKFKKSATNTPTWDDIASYLYLRPDGMPAVCPEGGLYRIGAVGQKPTCNIPGHVLP